MWDATGWDLNAWDPNAWLCAASTTRRGEDGSLRLGLTLSL